MEGRGSRRAAMLGTGSSIFALDGLGGGGIGFLGGVGVKTPAASVFAGGGVIMQGLSGDPLGGGDAPFTANGLAVMGTLSLLAFFSG